MRRSVVDMLQSVSNMLRQSLMVEMLQQSLKWPPCYEEVSPSCYDRLSAGNTRHAKQLLDATPRHKFEEPKSKKLDQIA